MNCYRFDSSIKALGYQEIVALYDLCCVHEPQTPQNNNEVNPTNE